MSQAETILRTRDNNHHINLPHSSELFYTLEGARKTVNDSPLLIVPGLNNSDANHWQTLWQKTFVTSRRIDIENWHQADLEKWRLGIKRALASIGRPSVLVAHSFGALAAASIAAEFPQWVEKLLLVAPADPDKFHLAQRLPQTALPVPTHLMASSNDPWMKESKAKFWAKTWGADYVCVGQLGHINSDSHIDIWPEGLQQLTKLIDRKDHRLEHIGKRVSLNGGIQNAFVA